MNILLVRRDKTHSLDTDAMSLDELKQLKSEIDDEIHRIKHQIGMARADFAKTGEKNSPHWFSKANHALAHRGKTAYLIQEAINERVRKDRVLSKTKADHFMDICREEMDAHAYLQFLNAADRRARDTAREAHDKASLDIKGE